MDFTQAYDIVDREELCKHLRKIGMPDFLMVAIKALYKNDQYILVDGHKQTDPISPTRGVKQGCPLSPLLFSLFINDFAPSSSNGVKLCESEEYISHLFYADDLTLLSSSPQNLDSLLRALHTYAGRNGLTINVKKSQFMVCSNARTAALHEFKYGDHVLEQVDEFKYLGVLFDKSGSLNIAEKQWARNLLIATNSVLSLASKHGHSSQLDLVLSLPDLRDIFRSLCMSNMVHPLSRPF